MITTNKPLAWQFRNKRTLLKCTDNCLSCKTTDLTDACFTKCTVYLITCHICNKVYVGQSHRTINSRITEHINCPKSFVHLHLSTHPNSTHNITWKILAVATNYQRRITLEALYIREYRDRLINGCSGIELIDFI